MRCTSRRNLPHAAAVARLSRGIAARVRCLDLASHWADMPENADVSNWLALGHIREELDALIESAPEFEEPAEAQPEGGYMKAKSKNSWASNVGNILRALETEPELKGAFGFNQMLRTEMVLRPVIVLHASQDRTMQASAPLKPRPVTDADVCRVQAHLQWFGFRSLGKDTAHEAVSTYARNNAYHHSAQPSRCVAVGRY